MSGTGTGYCPEEGGERAQGGVRDEARPFVGDYVPLALPAFFYFKFFSLIKPFLSAPAVFSILSLGLLLPPIGRLVKCLRG